MRSAAPKLPPEFVQKIRARIGDTTASDEEIGALYTELKLVASFAPGIEQRAATLEAQSLQGLVLPVTAESLREHPPARRFLVRDTDGRGVLPRGRVGMLAAAGGSGKSWAVMQLTVAVATGGRWFGAWPTERGRVLLILGEEDAEEANRRLHFAAALCSSEDVEAIAENVTVIAAAGVGLALTVTSDEFGGLPETPRAAELRALLGAGVLQGRPYSLVILDPSSRFAGADVEKDNAAATRYVQVLETLTAKELGGATVLLPAHTRKRGKDDESGNSDLMRGSSGLRDGVRWVGMLDQRRLVEGAPELLDFSASAKTNYGQRRPDLVLCRPQNGEGVLRAATEEEIEAYTAATSKRGSGEQRAAELRQRIVDELALEPASGNQLAKRLGARKATVAAAVLDLINEGRIRRRGDLALEPVPVIAGTVPSGSGQVRGNQRDGSRWDAPTGQGAYPSHGSPSDPEDAG